MRLCKVFVHDAEAGLLQETDSREYVFTYKPDYHGAPVCLAMPVRRELIVTFSREFAGLTASYPAINGT